MMTTEREPVAPGEMLREEFLKPLGLSQAELANAMGVPRRLVNEIVGNRRKVTADTALMLSRVLGTTAEFWLTLQSNHDLWSAAHSPARAARIEKAKPVVRSDGEAGIGL